MNEIIFILITLLSLSLPMIASMFGYTALTSCAVFLVMITLIFTSYIIEVFGHSTSSAICFFAAIFLTTDILGEKYGHKKALKTVSITVLANIIFVSLGLLITQLIPIENSNINSAISTFFTFIPRILIAGILAYAISQSIDVHLFALYKKYTKGKHLWIRNIGSTIISQFFDTIIFILLAFYGVLNNSILIDLFITTYIIKSLIALLDTPFCYIGKYISNKN